MTYARDPEGDGLAPWKAAVTRALAVLGQEWLGQRLGVTPSRLRQLANPMRPDLPTIEQAAAIDIEAARLGRGTPLFDAYQRRLAQAGVLPAPAWQAQFLALPAAVRGAVATMLGALAPSPREGAAA